MKPVELLTATRITEAGRLAATTQRDIWLSDDVGVRGIGRLLLRISPRGVKRFYFRGCAEGKRNTVALGPYSRTRQDRFLTIEQAREAARGCAWPSAAHVAPVTPRSVEPSTLAPRASAVDAPQGVAQPDSVPTVMDVCNAYVARLRAEGKSCARQTENAFLLYLAPTTLATMPASHATTEQFTAILRDIVKAGHGSMARRLRSQLHSAYENALRSKHDPSAPELAVDPGLSANPISQIASLARFSKPRDRHLSRTELSAFWNYLQVKAGVEPTMAHRFVRLTILLGGQRCKQLLRAEVKDVDLENALVELLDGKGNRTTPRVHVLPAAPTGAGELRWLVQNALDNRVSTLFPSCQKNKRLNDGSVSRFVHGVSDELLRLGVITTPFTYGDLRRTIETTGASLKLSSEVRAQLQSHGLSGIQFRHYDRYKYLDEKREALVTWESFLASLLLPDAMA